MRPASCTLAITHNCLFPTDTAPNFSDHNYINCPRVYRNGNTEVALPHQDCFFLKTDTKITEEVIQGEVDRLTNVVQAVIKYQELQILKGEGHDEQDWTVDVARGRIVLVKRE